MKLLLDTHALLWWFDGDQKLSRTVRRLIEAQDTEILVSAASVWEIATKSRLGKLPEAVAIAHRIPEAIAEQAFGVVPITVEHGQRAGWLPGPHRDPFDRMLAAQAQSLNIPIATTDKVFATFGVMVTW